MCLINCNLLKIFDEYDWFAMKIIVLLLLSFNTICLFSQYNVKDSLLHQDKQRLYILHIPPDYDGSKKVPMLIFLHGGGGNFLSAQGFTRFNPVSNKNGFITAYPQAYYESAPNSFIWADGRNTSADKAGIDDVGFIGKMTDTILAGYNVDRKKIYLCGFSNGSFLTQRIAFEDNKRYAAMAALGGTLDSNLLQNANPGRAIPMMYVFGMEDPFVPFEGGLVSGVPGVPVTGIESAVKYWAENNRCKTELDSVRLPDITPKDNSTITVFEYTDCGCNSDVKYYKIYGAGHTWPGVENESYEEIAGETNEDINAGEELWNFFNKYELCLSGSTVEEKNAAGMKVFPNPASDYIEINLDRWSPSSRWTPSEIKIYNSFVECIMSVVGGAIHELPLQRIDISHLPAGMYFIQIGNYTEKFMVLR